MQSKAKQGPCVSYGQSLHCWLLGPPVEPLLHPHPHPPLFTKRDGPPHSRLRLVSPPPSRGCTNVVERRGYRQEQANQCNAGSTVSRTVSSVDEAAASTAFDMQ